jgi:hypothetical protein
MPSLSTQLLKSGFFVIVAAFVWPVAAMHLKSRSPEGVREHVFDFNKPVLCRARFMQPKGPGA